MTTMKLHPHDHSVDGPVRWKMRVLVVEDDAVTANSLAQLLRSAGHDVEVARDGPAAVEVVRCNNPDVVILDIGLPGMDGWQVARRVHEEPAEKRPLLVAVTGHGAAEDVRASERAGIDLHLTKPIDPRQLQQLLDRFRSVIADE